MDNQVAIRMRRQERLVGDPPVALAVVIGENALRRPVGGPAVLRAQLRHLAPVVELPTVTVQVLSASTVVGEAMNGAFTIFDFDRTSLPSFVYLEHACGSDRKDKPHEVHAARSALDHLRATALDPRAAASVEVALVGSVTALRDSKNQDGRALVISARAWAALLAHV